MHDTDTFEFEAALGSTYQVDVEYDQEERICRTTITFVQPSLGEAEIIGQSVLCQTIDNTKDVKSYLDMDETEVFSPGRRYPGICPANDGLFNARLERLNHERLRHGKGGVEPYTPRWASITSDGGGAYGPILVKPLGHNLSDGCSTQKTSSLVSDDGRDWLDIYDDIFEVPCQAHDYCYDLIRTGLAPNVTKSGCDEAFHDLMLQVCIINPSYLPSPVNLYYTADPHPTIAAGFRGTPTVEMSFARARTNSVLKHQALASITSFAGAIVSPFLDIDKQTIFYTAKPWSNSQPYIEVGCRFFADIYHASVKALPASNIVGQMVNVVGPPTNVIANIVKEGVSLTWTAPTAFDGAIAGYRIASRIEYPIGHNYIDVVENTRSTTTEYVDTTVTAVKSYSYKVYAIDTVGQETSSSSASNTVTVRVTPEPTTTTTTTVPSTTTTVPSTTTTVPSTTTTVPSTTTTVPSTTTTTTPASAAPGSVTGLTATAANGSVTLSWTAPTDGGPVTGYRIERAVFDPIARRLMFETFHAGNTATSYTDTSPIRGQSHNYVVQARNGDEKGPSSQISITP